MNLPPNMFSIRFDEIQKGMTIYTDDTENGLGMTAFMVLEAPIVQGNIGTIKCENLFTTTDQDVLVNVSAPREMYTAKAQSGWRKM